jgi:cobalt/nickel transport system permease protein
MSDALLTPAVGAAMWGATAVTTVYCAKKVRDELDESKIPLMGVAGAFVFAAQMLNFAIPGTGSSGHIGGGLLLTALLGPYAAFLVIASVLGIQALFFADGGLIALGANIFNLGFFPAFIVYPLIFKPLVGTAPTRLRVLIGSVLAAVASMTLGATSVVLQTTISGISELPFLTFMLMMVPIHIAIGVVEGLVTAGVLLFVREAQPEILDRAATGRSYTGLALRPVIIGLLCAALLAGGAIAWFASASPDGLEWSIEKVAGTEEIEGATGTAHKRSQDLQERMSLLPDYSFKSGTEDAGESDAVWPAVDLGTTTSGVVGAALTIAMAALIGYALKRRSGNRTARG